MIVGAHSIIYSTNAEADRAFLRDVLELSGIDSGGGWLIFGLPPAEVAVHPAEKNDVHEFYLMCDDVEALVASLRERNVPCGAVEDRGWGLMTEVALPGGGKLGIYEPRHPRPSTSQPEKPARKPRASRPSARTTTASARKPAKKRPAAAKRKPPAKKKPPTRKPAKRRSRKGK